MIGQFTGVRNSVLQLQPEQYMTHENEVTPDCNCLYIQQLQCSFEPRLSIPDFILQLGFEASNILS